MHTTFPPEFDQAQWPNEATAPLFYEGTGFSIRDILKMMTPIVEHSMVVIHNVVLRVGNLQWATPTDDLNYPIYFEITGKTYHYVISIWADRATIEVCQLGTYDPLSAMFPVTEQQLREALATIVADRA